MEHLEYWIVIILLFVVIVLQQIERKDLYNRIMAGSLQEYKNTDKPRKAIKSIIKKNLEKNSDNR